MSVELHPGLLEFVGFVQYSVTLLQTVVWVPNMHVIPYTSHFDAFMYSSVLRGISSGRFCHTASRHIFKVRFWPGKLVRGNCARVGLGPGFNELYSLSRRRSESACCKNWTCFNGVF